LAGYALDIVLPPQCPSCNCVVESAGMLCGPCWRQIDFLGAPMCGACGLPFSFDPGLVEDVLCGACARHRPPYERARAVMAYGDFSRKLILAFKHGDRTDTAPALSRWLAASGRDLIADAEVIAPVQDLLVRRKRTPPQGRLSRSARRRNVRGAFKVHAARREGLAGRRVLLIDDVLTTGATAQACAEVLLRAGAKAVDV